MFATKTNFTLLIKAIIDFVFCRYWLSSGIDAFGRRSNTYFSGNRLDQVKRLSGSFVIQSMWRLGRLEWYLSKAKKSKSDNTYA